MLKSERWKSIHVDCWSELKVNLSWKSIWVESRSELKVDLSWKSIWVESWSELKVDLSWKSMWVWFWWFNDVLRFWWQTDWLTNGLTTLVVKSLSRLKINIYETWNHSSQFQMGKYWFCLGLIVRLEQFLVFFWKSSFCSCW